MLNITDMAEELSEITAAQETPETFTANDYVKIVVRAVKQFFVDINYPEEYHSESWITNDEGKLCYDRDFTVTEERYVEILAQLKFFQLCSLQYSGWVGYSTDALTVTNADKPYTNLKGKVDDLEHERRIVFNKMIRYTLGES